jgi:hypothetical protein
MRDLSRTAPHADQCFAATILATLAPAELAILDRYCERALDDPGAEPADAEERAAWASAERLVGRAAARMWRARRGHRRGHRPPADPPPA